MRKLLYVILLVLLHCFISPVSVCAGTFSLPDSLITDDNVYKYTFSDFEKAQQIMEQLRKRMFFQTRAKVVKFRFIVNKKRKL